MTECHKCPWNDRPPSDEKRTACLACVDKTDYSNLTNHGKVFVSIDASPKAQSAAEVAASKAVYDRQNDAEAGGGSALIDPEDPATRDAMKLGAIRAIKFLHDLDPDDRDVLFMAMYSTLAEYGRTIGKTRACTSKWWRDIVALRPELDRLVFSNANNPNRAKVGAKTAKIAEGVA